MTTKCDCGNPRGRHSDKCALIRLINGVHEVDECSPAPSAPGRETTAPCIVCGHKISDHGSGENCWCYADGCACLGYLTVAPAPPSERVEREPGETEPRKLTEDQILIVQNEIAHVFDHDAFDISRRLFARLAFLETERGDNAYMRTRMLDAESDLSRLREQIKKLRLFVETERSLSRSTEVEVAHEITLTEMDSLFPRVERTET